jgi:hypothetical protein
LTPTQIEQQRREEELKRDASNAERGWACCAEHPGTQVVCHHYYRSNRPTTVPLQCVRCSHFTVIDDHNGDVRVCSRCVKVVLFRFGVDTTNILSEINDTVANLSSNQLWSYVCARYRDWSGCRCSEPRDRRDLRSALRIL